MLGNWSLGDYFKQEQIPWSWEFLTSKEYLGINPKRLAVSVFAGDNDAPRDEECAKLWLKCGVPKDRIFYLPKANNWWGPAGKTGPCGPDSEMFIVADVADCSPNCSPACDCGKYLEIWNDVFMEYNKTAEGKFEPLKQKNVDTGMGLERTLCALNGVKSVYETDLFVPIIKKIKSMDNGQWTMHNSMLNAQCSMLNEGQDKLNKNDNNCALCIENCALKKDNNCALSIDNCELKKDNNCALCIEHCALKKAIRIIADHTRASIHLIGDVRGVVCSNVGQGYILRRLLRRAIRYAKSLGLSLGAITEIAKTAIEIYENVYSEIKKNSAKIIAEITLEEERFEKTISQGLKEFEKLRSYLPKDIDTVSGKAAFRLYDTYGFPIEMTEELAKEHNLKVDKDGYERCFKEHQEKSQANSAQAKGGLAENTE
jgi:alanyl-tRNA synthetase